MRLPHDDRSCENRLEHPGRGPPACGVDSLDAFDDRQLAGCRLVRQASRGCLASAQPAACKTFDPAWGAPVLGLPAAQMRCVYLDPPVGGSATEFAGAAFEPLEGMTASVSLTVSVWWRMDARIAGAFVAMYEA